MLSRSAFAMSFPMKEKYSNVSLSGLSKRWGTKEKSSQGNRQGDRIVQDENGNINVYRQASDNWF